MTALKALLLDGYFVLLEVKDDKYFLKCDNWAEIEPHSTKDKVFIFCIKI